MRLATRLHRALASRSTAAPRVAPIPALLRPVGRPDAAAGHFTAQRPWSCTAVVLSKSRGKGGLEYVIQHSGPACFDGPAEFQPGCKVARLRKVGGSERGHAFVSSLLRSHASTAMPTFVLYAKPLGDVRSDVMPAGAEGSAEAEVSCEDPVALEVVSLKKYMGKRAVVRNTARRRLKAAARIVFSRRAARGYAYLISARGPAAIATNELFIHQLALALQRMDLYSEHDLLPSTQAR